MLLSDNTNTNTITQAHGDFEFNNLEESSDTPYKDIEPLNGVTTYDLVLMHQHILTANLLDSPYKLIALDLNNSGTITTYDIVQLRQLVLFAIDDLPSNTNWRFVAADYNFAAAK